MKTNNTHSIKRQYEKKVLTMLLFIIMVPMLSYPSMLEELKAKAHSMKKHSTDDIQTKMRDRLRHSKIFNPKSNFDKHLKKKMLKEKMYSKVSSKAKNHNANAQFALGGMYYHGIKIKKNYKKALELYKKAALQGHTKAQFNLGYMYFDGRGTPKNHEEALRWFLKAAENHDGKAELYLGRLYEERHDDEKAFYWYNKASQRNYPQAYYELAHMYYVGKGCQKDLKKYIDYLEKAAIQSEARAAFDLGMAYLQGIGVKKDYNKGYQWLQKAYLNGDTRAKKILNKLKQRKNSNK